MKAFVNGIILGTISVAIYIAAMFGVEAYWQSRDSNYNLASAVVASYTGPGDVVSGATGWWGLRAYTAAIASAATQPAVNLSRASDSHTCDIAVATTGGLGLTKSCSNSGDNGTAVATWCNATTCSITEFYDQTGNTNNITQATGANQPTVTFSCIGSLPCAVFNGSSQVLTSASDAWGNQPTSYSAIIYTTGSSQEEFLDVSNAGNINGAYSVAGSAFIYAGTVASISTLSTSTVYAFQSVFNTTSSAANLNGTDTTGLSPGAGNAGTGSASYGARNGATQWWVGRINEGGIWGSLAFTLTQRTNLCRNQQAFYGAGNFGAAC